MLESFLQCSEEHTLSLFISLYCCPEVLVVKSQQWERASKRKEGTNSHRVPTRRLVYFIYFSSSPALWGRCNVSCFQGLDREWRKSGNLGKVNQLVNHRVGFEPSSPWPVEPKFSSIWGWSISVVLNHSPQGTLGNAWRHFWLSQIWGGGGSGDATGI